MLFVLIQEEDGYTGPRQERRQKSTYEEIKKIKQKIKGKRRTTGEKDREPVRYKKARTKTNEHRIRQKDRVGGAAFISVRRVPKLRSTFLREKV